VLLFVSSSSHSQNQISDLPHLDLHVWSKEGEAWKECRYVVRVADGVPAVPLRVPNELAHLFATTHNSVRA
jgi:hypothetical protein